MTQRLVWLAVAVFWCVYFGGVAAGVVLLVVRFA